MSSGKKNSSVRKLISVRKPNYVRKISPYLTKQGEEDTCWAHAIARLLSRAIKSLELEPHDNSDGLHNMFFFDEGEILDEYYDTITCSSQHTIFNCIIYAQHIHERKGRPFSVHKSLDKVINWESENLSGMLFHFIYNFIKNKFGCHSLTTAGRGEAFPIYSFFKLLWKGITEKNIKDILRYESYRDTPLQLPEIPVAQLSITESSPLSYEPPSSVLTEQSQLSLSPPSPLLSTEQSTPGKYSVIGGGITQLFPELIFNRLIAKLVSLFKELRKLLKNKTLEVQVFRSYNLNDFLQINNSKGFRDEDEDEDKDKHKDKSFLDKSKLWLNNINV
jgi:hypothetical protein